MSCLLKQSQDEMLQWKTLAKQHSMLYGAKFGISDRSSWALEIFCHSF